MREFDDTTLELRLRRIMTERLGSLPLGLTAEDLERRRITRDKVRRRHRVVIGLGLAATLVLPVGWLAAGGPGPIPPVPPVAHQTPGPTDHANPTGAPALTTTSGAYQAIAIRPADATSPAGSDLDVVAVRADGQERLVARLSAAAMPDGFEATAVGYVSPSGWLAVGDRNGTAVALVDLRDPTAPIRTVRGSSAPDDIAWGPDGRLAVRGEAGITVIDPSTGVSTLLPTDLATGSKALAWAADGSALVVTTGGVRLGTPDRTPAWLARQIATGATEVRFVPIFDAGRGRRQSQAGDRIVLCRPHLHAMGTCRGSSGYELGRQDTAGLLTIWDVTSGPGFPDDAQLAAHDRAIWLLRDDPASGEYILQRLDAEGIPVETVTAPMPQGVAPSASDRDSMPSNIQLETLAPDDSLARIVAENDDPDITEWFLLPMDGVPGTYHQGGFAGYLSSAVADLLGSGAFSPVAGVDAPAVAHAPELPSNDLLDTFAAARSGVTAGDPVLLRADRPTSVGQTTIDLGDITQLRGHRITVQFACAGPSSVEVELGDLGGVANQCMQDDQSWGFYDRIPAPAVDTVRSLKVVVDNGAAWRLAVYDLGPP